MCALRCAASGLADDPPPVGPALVDHRAGDDRHRDQLPDPFDPRRRRADDDGRPRHHHRAVQLDHRRLSARHHAPAGRRLHSRSCRPAHRPCPLRRRLGPDHHGPRPGLWLEDAGRPARRARLCRRAGHPGGLKVVAEWFPARERGFAAGIYNLGASFGGDAGATARLLGDLDVELARRLRPRRRARPGLGLAVAADLRRAEHPGRSTAEREHIEAGQEAHLGRRPPRPPLYIAQPAQLLGHRFAAFPRRSDVGHADLLDAALSDHGARLRPWPDRAVRLAALRRRRCRLPVRAGRGVLAPASRHVAHHGAQVRLHPRRLDDGRHAVRRPGSKAPTPPSPCSRSAPSPTRPCRSPSSPCRPTCSASTRSAPSPARRA